MPRTTGWAVLWHSQQIVLSGGLSNRHFKDLLQCLTSEKSRKPPQDGANLRAAGQTVVRKFGTVGGAVTAVLAGAQAELRVAAIHSEVEGLLSGTVSF